MKPCYIRKLIRLITTSLLVMILEFHEIYKNLEIQKSDTRYFLFRVFVHRIPKTCVVSEHKTHIQIQWDVK